MDSITQGVLGAAAAQMILGGKEQLGRRAWLYGCVGGVAPDLDIFIRSASDPMVALEYHRHFTHSIFFIPLGGTLAALPWALRPVHRAKALAIIAATTAGYATHALLDAFTSYGTMMLWPLSRIRVAWNWIAIVDLGYTLPLIVGVILAARRRSRWPAIAALVACNLYLGLCGIQRARALAAQERLIAARGHTASRVEVFPTLLNHVTWRSLYVADGVVFADKVRVPWLVEGRAIPGSQVRLLEAAAAPAAVREDPRTRAALALFVWFSDGWLAEDPVDVGAIGDLRYAVQPGEVASMWKIRLDPAAATPVVFERTAGARNLDAAKVWATLFEDGGGAPVIGAVGRLGAPKK
jgi:inner membrane protein